jgi:4'-phosphopantetheinyl transferase
MIDPVRAHRFLAGRLALRCLVAEAVGVAPGLVVPAYRCPDCGPGEHGVPGFVLAADADADTDDGGARLPLSGAAGRALPVAASMSRAGGWALLAAEVTPCGAEVTPCGAEVTPCGAEVTPSTRPGAAIGVDLAAVADFRVAIPDAALSAAERRRAHRAADLAAETARIWARKEALLKAMGSGLRGDPSTVDTLGDLRVRDLEPSALGLPPGFAAAFACVPSAPA